MSASIVNLAGRPTAQRLCKSPFHRELFRPRYLARYRYPRQRRMLTEIYSFTGGMCDGE